MIACLGCHEVTCGGALGPHPDVLARLESLWGGHSENIALGPHIDVLARLESLWGQQLIFSRRC